jgi:hypothetical protein
MENTLDAIDIGKAIVKKHTNGHLYITVREGQELDVDDIKAMVQAKNQLCGDLPHTTVLIAGNYSSISNEARAFASSKEAYGGAIAKSIVTKSLPTRLVGNFFIRFNNPPAPTKLFACEKEAVRWLNQMRDRLKSLH